VPGLRRRTWIAAFNCCESARTIRIPSPGTERGFEISGQPLALVTHRKFDCVIGGTRDANPDASALINWICVFCRIGYQLIGYEGNRNCPVGHDVDTRLDRDLDMAQRRGFVQILTNVPDVDAEIAAAAKKAIIKKVT
jgi:hypothetical protein